MGSGDRIVVPPLLNSPARAARAITAPARVKIVRVGPERQAILALAVHLLVGVAALRLDFTQDLHARFLPEDPAVAALQSEQALFGIGETMAVLVESDQLLHDPSLPDSLRRWQRELAALDGVRSVSTVLDVPVIVTTPAGSRLASLGEWPDPLRTARHHALAAKTFLRRDAAGTLLLVTLEPELATDLERRQTLAAIVEDWIRTTEGGRDGGTRYRLTAAGTLPLHVAAIGVAYRDVAVIAAPLLVALAALLSFGLGSAAAAASVVVTSLLNLSATLGTAAILGWQVSQFSFIVMPVVLTVGLLDGIHLALAYRRAGLANGSGAAYEGNATAPVVIGEVFTPCAWTTVTTAAGFCVLTASSIPQIRQFGALSAVGTVWALFTSFVLLPGLLARLRLRTVGHRASRGSTIPRRIARMKRPGLVVATTVTVLAATAPGLARIQVVADFPRLFDRDHAITVELERIERDWGGIASVSFLLTPLPGRELGDADVIERLSSFGRLLTQRELITSVVSPLDILGTARPDAAAVEALIAQARTGPGASLLSELVDTPTGTIRVVARVRMMQPEKFPALVADLEGFRTGLEDLFEVELAGWPLVFKNLETRLLDELLTSFALAFGVVAILLMFALGSARWWLAALIPNLAPLWIVLGALGLTGTGFSSGLLLAPGIALGLVVDDTIHFVSALRRETGEGWSLPDAIERTIVRTGAALTLTSAVLMTGFGTLLLSAFRGNRTLGAVMVIVSLTAWLADLVVLPAVLLVAQRWSGLPDHSAREARQPR